MNNKAIGIAKFLIVTVYTVAVILLLRLIPHPLIFILTMNLSIMIWLVMVYVFATCHFAKWRIQRKLSSAKCHSLKEISLARLMTYKRSKQGDFVTLKFCSEGVPIEIWENNRHAVQSAINHTIIGEIEHAKNDWGIVIFNARKGRFHNEEKELLDDEF